MSTTTFRTRVVMLPCLAVAALAGVAVAAFYVGVWLVSPRGGPANDAAGPTLRFTARYEGAPAAVVEETVTLPLENALANLESVDTIESFSREGEAAITLFLRPGTDLDRVSQAAQERLVQAQAGLPEVALKQ